MNMEKVLKRLDRVMISEHEAISPVRASRDHGIRPSIIFVRKDGWSLGAHSTFTLAAYKIWENDWEYWCKPPNMRLRPISTYREAIKLMIGED